MSAARVPTVDVRDMLCAQALAAVARTIGDVAIGQTILVRYNAEDVKADLLTWAQAAGHDARPLDASTLRLERGALTP